MAHITLYDTTLRDGAQTQGVDFSVADELSLAKELDAFGIDYIVGLTRNDSTACHPTEGEDPELSETTGFPPEFILTKVGAGMTPATYSRRFA